MSQPAVLYQAEPVRGASWARIFAAQAPEFSFKVWPDHDDLASTEFLIAWKPDPALLRRLPRLRILFSLGAGVDQLDQQNIPPQVRIVRLVDPGIVQGMTEYVVLSVLALHRQWPDYWLQQQRREWRDLPNKLAPHRRIGIMGAGVLGQSALAQLRPFGFQLRVWSRNPAPLPGVESFAGSEQLPAFLRECDILVCLLPLTPQTQGILDRRTFDALPRGAAVVNAGRGGQLVAADLIEAMNSGQISAAVLDVTDPEPLPPDHPLWRQPKVLITSHGAAHTLPESAAPIVIANLRRERRGEELLGEIDRRRGY